MKKNYFFIKTKYNKFFKIFELKFKKMKIGKVDKEKRSISLKKMTSNYLKDISKSDTNINVSAFYINNYCYTDNNPSLFLDYTFKGNKNKLYNNNFINIIKAKNYKYELEQTFRLNLDILLSYYKRLYNNKINKNNNWEILLLLNKIKIKEKIRRETKEQLIKKCNQLISKYDYANSFHKKLDNQFNQYNIKIRNKIGEIDECVNYIKQLKKRFYGVEKYINRIRFNSEGRKGLHKKNKFMKFISSNNKYLNKISNYMNDIKKIKSNISELKKDNKLSRTQMKLIKVDNPDINLIRVVEFYIRIIRNAALRNKILKNSINSMTKTLEFLDLNKIINFNEYKRNHQKSSYEIEFSNLEDNDIEENERMNIKMRIKSFMNFNKILNK